MKDEHPPVHQLEHAEPIVIHHPEEDMTILARWLQRAMDQGPKFWLLVVGAVAALILVSTIAGGLAASKSAGSEAWSELTQAKTVEERIKIAEAHPNTPVATWAKLLSAEEEYANGVDDLTSPGKKELAGPRLKKALDLFQQVAKEAPPNTPQALGGMFGAARTLEARNELPEAIEQYRLVATKFPGAPEAKQALALVKALEEPTNVQFYKELYAYKPPATPASPGTGPGGPGSFLPPPLDFGAPRKSFLPDMTAPQGIDAPPPSTGPTPAPEAPKADATKKDEAPAPSTTATPADVPKAEVPKAEPPK